MISNFNWGEATRYQSSDWHRDSSKDTVRHLARNYAALLVFWLFNPTFGEGSGKPKWRPRSGIRLRVGPKSIRSAALEASPAALRIKQLLCEFAASTGGCCGAPASIQRDREPPVQQRVLL